MLVACSPLFTSLVQKHLKQNVRYEKILKSVQYCMGGTVFMDEFYLAEYTRAVEEYIEALMALPKDEARRLSLKNLIDAGIVNPDGTPKEQIVNGDFFGW